MLNRITSVLWVMLIATFTSKAVNFGPQEIGHWEMAEWQLQNSSWSGIPYDLMATVTYTHSSGFETSTEMFYDLNDTWKFRFNGSLLGSWQFTTSSSDPDLNGHTGTIDVTSETSSENGFLVRLSGDKWGWGGTGRAIVPNYLMYEPSPEAYFDNPQKVDQDIQEFIVEHGFSGFHLPNLSTRWFVYNASSNRFSDRDYRYLNNENITPDPRTFEALELLIRKTYQAGGGVHIWSWGDASRNQNFNSPFTDGLTPNGVADQRLMRYIAARLAALPGWSMGYGFDLFEWTNAEMLETWRTFMQDKMGWFHFLGARGRKNSLQRSQLSENMDYTAYEQHHNVFDFEDWLTTMADRPGKPSFSEDRFRVQVGPRPKNLTFDITRTLMWELTMAGGIAGIWGNLSNTSQGTAFSLVYDNKDELKTYSRFWFTKSNYRFLVSLVEANILATDQTRILKTPTNDKFLLFKENTSSMTVDLSGLNGVQNIIAVDAKGVYAELSLGNISPADQTITLPYISDWAIAIGDFGDDPGDPTPVTLSVNSGTGSGQYEAGETVVISADAPPSNQVFDTWTGDINFVDDISSPFTTVTMPSFGISLTATYKASPDNSDPGEEPDFTTVNINFQPASSPIPQNYIADTGNPYGVQTNGYSYGWLNGANTNTRDRNTQNDAKTTTLNHLQKNQNRIWEIALPNGSYNLEIGCVDPSFSDQVNNILVEQTLLPDTDGQDNSDIYTTTIAVDDGKLTLQPGPNASNAKISYINISATDAVQYALTVNAGSGDGTYFAETSVMINADPAPVGQTFDRWIGDVGVIVDATLAQTTLVIPEQNIEVSATYKDLPTDVNPIEESIHINFQPPGSETPSGFVADIGEEFGLRTNGLEYGWLGAPNLDFRERNGNASLEAKTLTHLQKDENKVWEIKVENGTYELEIGCIDPSYKDQINTLDVEGTLLLDPDGQDKTDVYQTLITVSDGRITIQPGPGAVNAKISYVLIHQVQGNLRFSNVSQNTLRVYPSLTAGVVTINSPVDDVIKVIDATGRTLAHLNVSTGKSEKDIGHLTSGMYYLIFDKQYAIKKIMLK